ncbi:MAG: protein kinase, partial [Candidatus Eisenbacteria sp.]|nr:protein kinase [Candidatus Eisenbacteria bacterium]
MGQKDDNALKHLAEAVTDETAIDWDAERNAHPEHGSRLERLRLVERIATFHRIPWKTPSVDRDASSTQPPFPWCHLKVTEEIGTGSYGTVYRAEDPRLQRAVALKLLHPDLSSQTLAPQRFLEEARRMARVRHPNVLVIHGAGEDRGRVGFWMELIDGSTLEQRLEKEGSFGVGEASLIGIEVCRALAAVHGAGIVHGDVKASNVMRDAGGRILLADFGAGSEVTKAVDAPSNLVGTPLFLAPELLEGAAPSPQADIYALGVLLHRLVSGTFPLSGGTIDELREQHRRGERQRLSDLRPDLPAAWVAIIERCLAGDPAARFKTVGELEDALGLSIREVADATSTSPRAPGGPARGSRTWMFALVAMLAVGASLIWFETHRRARDAGRTAAPGEHRLADAGVGMRSTEDHNVSFEIDARLYRAVGGTKELLPYGSSVGPGDALFMELEGSEDLYVYVLNEDLEGNVFLLFPLADLDVENPLPSGSTHRLPGTCAGVGQDWQVTSRSGHESFLIVASRERLDELEGAIASLTPAVAGRPLSRGAEETQTAALYRGVGGLVSASPDMAEEGTSRLSGVEQGLLRNAEDPRD